MMGYWSHGGRRGSSLTFSLIVALAIILLLSISLYPERQKEPQSPPSWWHLEEQRIKQHNTGVIGEAPKPQTPMAPLESWSFDVKKHGKNYGLTEEQCVASFPDYYREIERAVRHRAEKKLGQVSKDMIDISWREAEIMRLMIYDGQLYIIDTKWAVQGWDLARGLALIGSIHRAVITSPSSDGPVPNIEFAINLSDWPLDKEHNHPLWVLARPTEGDEQTWVMPDFGYFSWPEKLMGEYSQIRGEIEENEPAWADKQPKAVWRGAVHTNDLRKDLVREAEGKEWADVRAIDWSDAEGMRRDALTIPEHCNYQYVIHTEGHSYSGRAKYLLNCRSVSITPAPTWTEPHTHLLAFSGPAQNAVLAHRNFSDLPAHVARLAADPRLAERVAANAAADFRDRYLAPAAQTCYWRRMFRAWRSVSGFEPELYETVKDGGGEKGARGGSKRVVRGVAYESFISRLALPKTQ